MPTTPKQDDLCTSTARKWLARMTPRTLLGTDRNGQQYWADADDYVYYHESGDRRDFVCTRNRIAFTSDGFVVIV